MSSTTHHYRNLFNRLLEGELSPQDTNDLIAWLGKEELDTDAKELIVAQLKQFVDPEKISPQVILALETKLSTILGKNPKNSPGMSDEFGSDEIPSEKQKDYIRPVPRIHFLK